MVRFEKSGLPGLTAPNSTRSCEAIKEGKLDQAIELVEHMAKESAYTEGLLVKMLDIVLSYLAEEAGEEAVARALRRRTEFTLPGLLAEIKTPEDSLVRVTTFHRGHGSTMSIKEDNEKYIFTLDPCGTMGRLWRSGPVGTTKKAYPWSWNRTGVPYYCAHCCLQSEIMPVEARGYPIGIHESPRSPQDPCIRYFYKKPELIPEKYFTRIGMRKTIV